MKTRRHISGSLVLAAAALLCLAGCKKDEGEKVVLGVDFEQTAGMQKTYIGNSDRTVYWSANDQVMVNDDVYTVHDGVVEVNMCDDGYAAVYPASTDNSLTYSSTTKHDGSTCTGGQVVIPATQKYTLKDGKQVLGGPMAALLNEKTGRLLFRNLYAVIKVTVQTKTDRDFKLASITVESTNDKILAGTQKFTFHGDTKTNEPKLATLPGGLKSVTLDDIDSIIPANNIASFYLYAVPFTEASLTIRLNGASVDTLYAREHVSISRSNLKYTTVQVIHLVPEPIDLDLTSGTLWAPYNVGADTPWDYGDYFAWGETEPYYESLVWTSATSCTPTWKSGKNNGYYWQSYCGHGQSKFTEWTSIPYDNSTKLLNPDYDAANVNWKGYDKNWRTPTTEEIQELISNCTWEWTSKPKFKVEGMKVSSKTDPTRYIFFPAANWFQRTEFLAEDNWGYYMSATLHKDYQDHAYILYMGDPADSANRPYIDDPLRGNGQDPYTCYDPRCRGYSVRPVKSR